MEGSLLTWGILRFNEISTLKSWYLKKRLIYSFVWNSLFLTSGWDADVGCCGEDQKHSVRRILFLFRDKFLWAESPNCHPTYLFSQSSTVNSGTHSYIFHIVLIFFLLLWIMYYGAEKSSKVYWREEKKPLVIWPWYMIQCFGFKITFYFRQIFLFSYTHLNMNILCVVF